MTRVFKLFPYWLKVVLFCLVTQPCIAYSATGPQLFKAGRKAFQKGEYYKAKKWLLQASKKLPHWGFIRLSLARAMQFNGDPAKEIAPHVIQATQLIPKNPRVHLFAGLFWEGQGKTKRALAHYQKALQLGHFSSKPCIQAARIWIAQKQWSKAIHCLEQQLKKRQPPSSIHFLLAQTYEKTGKIVRAGTHWMRALSYRRHSLVLLQKVYMYYTQHTPREPPALRREWLRIRRRLHKQLLRALPKQKKRRLRPLLPSRR